MAHFDILSYQAKRQFQYLHIIWDECQIILSNAADIVGLFVEWSRDWFIAWNIVVVGFARNWLWALWASEERAASDGGLNFDAIQFVMVSIVKLLFLSHLFNKHSRLIILLCTDLREKVQIWCYPWRNNQNIIDFFVKL